MKSFAIMVIGVAGGIRLFLNRCFEATANASMVCSSLYSVPSSKADVVSFYDAGEKYK